MRTSSHIHLARLAKATRRSYPAPTKNARPGVEPGLALKWGSDRGRIVPSGRGLRDPRQ